MLIRPQPPLHLTYCLNVHPGERWSENLAAIETHARAVRDRVAPTQPFGLGLRLSRQAADELAGGPNLAAFRRMLADNLLYAFTVNGFPYGSFHGAPVKTQVYRPDWSLAERRDYTIRLAEILAALLPDGVDGSISTVPLSYKPWGSSDGQLRTMIDNLVAVVARLAALRRETGREIHIGLEPEPDCLLETTDEVVRFFEGPLASHGVPMLASLLACSRPEAETLLRRHLGVCVDTCHLAVQFESPTASLARLRRHGIRVSKIQLSAALEVDAAPTPPARLREFCDPVYLHQVRRRSANVITGYADLPEALAAPESGAPSVWRIHFHVPLYFTGDADLRSTAPALDDAFWAEIARGDISHLEIETYTFHVLPPSLRTGTVAESIAREFAWVLPRCKAALGS